MGKEQCRDATLRPEAAKVNLNTLNMARKFQMLQDVTIGFINPIPPIILKRGEVYAESCNQAKPGYVSLLIPVDNGAFRFAPVSRSAVKGYLQKPRYRPTPESDSQSNFSQFK